MVSPTSPKQNDELKVHGRILAEARRQETFDAWNEFQATGLHVTSNEIEKWLSTWGTDDELPIPECHR
ncbi:CopG family transcriptional regulator [Rhizobium leguminosarum]|uniref:CopG family transcriptional regulator n=1 Tax=Rhizobium johnstonii TaxID=3019933 RepID=UPI0003A365C3|nr:CopG family transcriptional regulator [Rhizobium leguminosarum]